MFVSFKICVLSETFLMWLKSNETYGKEIVVAWFKVLIRHFTGGTDKNQEKRQDIWDWDLPIRSRIANHSAATFGRNVN